MHVSTACIAGLAKGTRNNFSALIILVTNTDGKACMLPRLRACCSPCTRTCSCFRGYVGQWCLWAPPASSNSNELQKTDDEVKFRMFQLTSGDPPAVHQVNMQRVSVPSPATAAFKTFMTSDVAAGRPDGYGIRQWDFTPVGTLWDVSSTAGIAVLLMCISQKAPTGVRAFKPERFALHSDLNDCHVPHSFLAKKVSMPGVMHIL